MVGNFSIDYNKQVNYIQVIMKIKQKNQMLRKQSSSEFYISDSVSEEQSHPRDISFIKKQRKMKQKFNKISSLKKKNHGLWTANQQNKFIEFMKNRRSIFQDKQLRRTHKIFKEMARVIKTRSSQQCRSHHQKYEIKLKTFDNIVAYVEGKIIDSQIPGFINDDSPYDFIVNPDQQWDKNPVYGQLPKTDEIKSQVANTDKTGMFSPSENIIKHKLRNKQIVSQNKCWSMMKVDENSFKIKLMFDNFL